MRLLNVSLVVVVGIYTVKSKAMKSIKIVARDVAAAARDNVAAATRKVAAKDKILHVVLMTVAVYKRMKVPMLWMPMPACPHLTTPSWLVLFETVGLAGCLADHLHTFEKQL